ncbi:FadR family transcriptional regulator [Rhodococcus triatomae]|uniref:DNA-binding transcriptional regulator, FadR family n=1 Tax=Rhodococcus triatomae TaxID=300028 RepID=A0A1G8F6D1_9NOCA|nr:FadR/GntR family transcriptional regulator [Rhodococcus triatomae]QNG19400.1 FadR family transcriptional regulator [Rhodococcus triatomae]QNG24687.1 FadR family transcriptional regulator [Rhodococcus triatomae]SDH77662.1 DNA-binding transcriptional regulator, FadR family [Rhodococcus triatomae]
MTNVKPVRRSGLVAQVTDQLRTEIREGRWAVGDRIPTEPALAELTGTGRNTVREAVQALVHAGLLERRQGSGTYVVGTSDVGNTLTQYFVDAHERDVLELRRALDVTAAELAAERRSDTDVSSLTEKLALRRRLWDAGRTEESVDADIALHRAIVEASHNAVYLEFYDSLLPAIRELVIRRTRATGEGHHSDHEALVEAIVAAAPQRAADAARSLFHELLT